MSSELYSPSEVVSHSSNEASKQHSHGRRRGSGRGRSNQGGSVRSQRQHRDFSSHAVEISESWISSVPLMDCGFYGTHKSFAADLDQVINRSVEANVRTIVLTGTTVFNSRQMIDIVKRISSSRSDIKMYSTAGVHPHNVRHCDENTLQELEALVASPEVIAVGECGLDFNRNFSLPDTQIKWFGIQIKLALKFRKPLFLHERDSFEGLIALMDAYYVPSADMKKDDLPPVCVHCFTGKKSELMALVSRGYYIGITGYICKPKGEEVLDALKDIPVDRLLIESGSPFMAPPDSRIPLGGRNEPLSLVFLLETLASKLGLPQEELAVKLNENSNRFFNLS